MEMMIPKRLIVGNGACRTSNWWSTPVFHPTMIVSTCTLVQGAAPLTMRICIEGGWRSLGLPKWAQVGLRVALIARARAGRVDYVAVNDIFMAKWTSDTAFVCAQCKVLRKRGPPYTNLTVRVLACKWEKVPNTATR